MPTTKKKTMTSAAPKKALEKKSLKAAPAPAPESSKAAAAGATGAQQTATGGTSEQQSASFKNFRHHPEMENFYRFVYENDLRFEALAIIDEIMTEKAARKRLKAAGGGARKTAH